MLDVFIEGELVDLAIPTEAFAAGDIWYKWFNDASITQYLDQGVYPNTRQQQVAFFNSMSQERLALIVQNKSGKPIGIVSLSFINHQKKSCDFAIAIDTAADIRIAGVGALEASAIIIQHGFDMLGMKRINAGQHVDLLSWQQRLELIGFQFEGYHKNKFVKGSQVEDSVSIAVVSDDYEHIKQARGGVLWDSYTKMKKRIQALPSTSIRMMFDDEFSKAHKKYYDEIYAL